MKGWNRAHWTIVIALAGVVSLHLKGAHSWGEALSYDSVVELFATVVTVLSALNVGRPKDRTKIATLEGRVDNQNMQIDRQLAQLDIRRRRVGTMVGGGAP